LPTGHLEKFSFFSLQSFGGLLPSILIGISIFVIGMKYHLFHIHFPVWLSIDYWYTRAANSFISSTKTISHLSGYLSRLVFAIFVDMWLPNPMSKSELYTTTETIGHKAGKTLSDVDGKVLDRLVDGVASAGQKASGIAAYVDMRLVDKAINGVAGLGQKTSKAANLFDMRLIDKAINGVAGLGQLASKAAGLFDYYVIDNIVNAVGVATKSSSRKLRPIQTGDVQSYGSLMVLSIAILLIAILIFIVIVKAIL
ncbi:MAG: hypothetical protein HY776_04960, partial [Actinobacteria bacterium]|nr:hypothetical protein [Actinomycetota bacterium]